MVGWEVQSKHIVTSDYRFASSVHTHINCNPRANITTDCQDGGWKAARSRRLRWRCGMFEFAMRAQRLHHSDHNHRPTWLIVPALIAYPSDNS